MIDATDKLMESWISLLNGISVDVYDEAVPDNVKDNYVQLRIEGETETPVSRRFWITPVLITDIVTRFHTIPDPKIARGINSEIKQRVRTTSGIALQTQSGMQFGNIYELNSQIINEEIGSKYYYRIVTRYRIDIMQPKN